jgi:hypothetical protein
MFFIGPLLFAAFGCVSSWDKRAWNSSQSDSVVMHVTHIGFYYIRGHFSGGCAHVVTSTRALHPSSITRVFHTSFWVDSYRSRKHCSKRARNGLICVRVRGESHDEVPTEPIVYGRLLATAMTTAVSRRHGTCGFDCGPAYFGSRG